MSHLHVEMVGEAVCQLTIHNEARRNALDGAALEALHHTLTTATGVRAWLVRGAGSTFCAGYDLTELAAWTPGTGPFPDERLAEVLDLLARHPAPSVAMVQGPAFGAGCELMMACDLRVADASAVISMPAARLGVVYRLGGLQRFVDRVGPAATRYLFLTAARVGAEEALRRGLVDVVADDAPSCALALGEGLAASAPLSLEGTKLGLAALGGDAAARARHELVRTHALGGPDVKEGLLAALHRRAPRFTGG